MKKRADFAVRRGRTFTTFQTASAAEHYWKSTVGGVFMVRNSAGDWMTL